MPSQCSLAFFDMVGRTRLNKVYYQFGNMGINSDLLIQFHQQLSTYFFLIDKQPFNYPVNISLNEIKL